MTGRRRSSATELKIADALAEREAWDEDSEVTETDLWVLVQPRLPRGDAGRAYAQRAGKKAASDTEPERIAKGQRMFFDDALRAMDKAGQVQQNDAGIWLGSEPLWRAAGENAPLEIYTPGWHGLKDAEARRRAEDRKRLERILKRKAFEVSPDSANYQALLWSMQKYGYRSAYPIVIDDSTDPPFVLDGRTRLAVARQLGIEDQVLAAAHKVRADSTFALGELMRGNFARRQLSGPELAALKELRDHSDADWEVVRQVEAVVRENEDRAQRNQDEKNQRIREALLEDPARSDRKIARDVRASHPTVAGVRQELQIGGKIDHLKFATGGRGNTAARVELIHEARQGCCEGLEATRPANAELDARREIIARLVPEIDASPGSRSDTEIAQEAGRRAAAEMGREKAFVQDTIQDDWDALSSAGRIRERNRRAATPAPAADETSSAEPQPNHVSRRTAIAATLRRLGQLWAKPDPIDPRDEERDLRQLIALAQERLREIGAP